MCSESLMEFVLVAWSVAGSANATTESRSNPALSATPFLLNVCSLCFSPPQKNAMPSTSSVLVKMEPARRGIAHILGSPPIRICSYMQLYAVNTMLL
jgi:hypothetical protein